MKYDIDFIRSIRESAGAYFKLGFNVTGLKDFKKAPYHRWKHFQTQEQVVGDAVSHEWYRLTGIGVITGIKSLFCFDFDKCDLIHLPSFLEKLGLPPSYNWIVISGSGKGFHIWFSSEELQKSLKAIGTSVLVYKPKQNGQFSQLELRLNCHVVMPPSKSVTGNQYRFLHPNDLTERPKELDYEKTVKSFVEEVGTLKVEEKKQGKLYVPESSTKGQDKRAKKPSPKITDLETFSIASWYANELTKKHIDITGDFQQWLRVAFAFAHAFNEAGRSLFHLVSSANYSKYSRAECDHLFSNILIQNRTRDPNKDHVTIGTFFKLAHQAGIKFNPNGKKRK